MFEQSEKHVLMALVTLSIIVYALLKVTKVHPGNEGLFAYVLISMIPIGRAIFISLTSLLDGSMRNLSTDRNTRLYATHAGFIDLAELTFAYELWNTGCALALPEFRTFQFIGHHVATATLSKLAQQPYLPFMVSSSSAWLRSPPSFLPS